MHVVHKLIHFHRDVFCPDGGVIEVCAKNVKKTFEGPDRDAKLQKLKSVYDILKAKAVPNVDSLSLSFSDDTHGTVAYLEPRGISTIPINAQEVYEAICCILEALERVKALKPLIEKPLTFLRP